MRAGVINNTRHGYGRGLLAKSVTGSCRFSDNQYVYERKVAAVEVAIAAENRVECSRNARALDLTLGNAKALTVLGNIVGGLTG